MKNILILIIPFLFLIPNLCDSATLFIDNFENYTDGNLNGQEEWIADTTYQVISTTTAYEGSKAIYYDGSVGDVLATKVADTYVNDGSTIFYVRRNDNTERAQVWLKEGATNVVRLIFLNGNIQHYSGGWVSIQAYSANVWYKIKIEWRSSDHKYRITIDDGTPTDWYQYNAWTSGVDRLIFDTQNPAGPTYFDCISEDGLCELEIPPEEPAATTTEEETDAIQTVLLLGIGLFLAGTLQYKNFLK